MSNCLALQQSDEMFCAKCNLRWDVNDRLPPACGNRPAPRPEIVSQALESFKDLRALEEAQRATMAVLIRACVARLKSPDSRKRAEAIDSLAALADQLETPR